MKKKKGKVLKVIVILFVVALLAVGSYFGYTLYIKDMLFKEIDNTSKAFIASTKSEQVVYDLEYNESISLIRGTEVLLYEKEVIQKDDNGNDLDTFRKIKYDDNEYLIKPENITDDVDEVVKEDKIYVRTSLTTYVDSENPDIYGFKKKGSELEVTGFDKLNEDGTVNMYKVKDGDGESFVYSKYTTLTLEEAKKVYNENGIYDIHKKRKYYFELYGGSAKNLDYYPYEKPSFDDNKLLAESKTYYLVGTKYLLADIDKYISLAKSSGATAFVLDIKDGALSYKSEVAKKYSPTSYKNAYNSVDAYKKAVDKIKNAGIYVIGRIVLFNDSSFATDNPKECIKSSGGVNTKWVSAYSRKAWEYNVKLAKESISLFGFNEIQFDYVRFPEASYSWSRSNYNFNNKYKEEKAEAVQSFLYYAADEIHKDHVYLSVDVFGESSSEYVTAYGQYWPAISNIVDVISGMPYTDHFDRNDSNYWNNPYQTLYNWGSTAAQRQKEIPTPAKVRTWITAYDTPYWNPTKIYGANEISAQVKGLVDAGLGCGFITWNGNSNYSKYSSISAAFKKEY